MPKAIAENSAIILSSRRGACGLSTIEEGGKLESWPELMNDFADYLGIDRFGQLGVSGGGPYVLETFRSPWFRLLSGKSPMPASKRLRVSVIFPRLCAWPRRRWIIWRKRAVDEWNRSRILAVMPPVDISQNPNESPPEMDGDDWVPVGHYDNLREANEHGLVILAMGEACRVEPAPAAGQFDLQAERGPAVNIVGELDEYAREQAEEKACPPARHFPTRPAGAWLCCLWALVLTAVFVRQAADDTLVERGASSSIGLFARGEWWRPLTALFLHADIPHLAGNLLAGCLFATLVARSAGAVRGWLLIFASGIAGNVLTAWVMYPQPFVSLGASTAVFGALGILSGMGLIEMLHERTRRQFARITAPLLAGLVLLGWLGSGTHGHTDVLAHVFGFGSGLAAGAASGAFDARSSSGEILA